MRRLVVLAVILVGSTVWADTQVFDFSKFDPADWELVNIQQADVRADGLHLVATKGGGRVGLVGRAYYRDQVDATLEFDRVRADVHGVQIHLDLENPVENAACRIHCITEPINDREGRRVVGSRVLSSILKDGQPIYTGGGFDYGNVQRLRIIKEGPYLWPLYYGDRSRGWKHTIIPPFRTRGEKCETFRVAVYVDLGWEATEGEIVLKRLSVWSPVLKLPGRPEPDPKVKRFDFGPIAQQLEADYAPVCHRTLYDSERGYGFITDLEPLDNPYFVPALNRQQSLEAGMIPTDNQYGSTKNFCVKYGKRYIMGWSNGGDYVEFYKRYLDLKIPCERDMVGAFRCYGFEQKREIEADQWEQRAAIYVDDDLSTKFRVGLPNDRYTLLVGVGYGMMAPPGRSSFSLDAQSLTVKKGLSCQSARCHWYRIDDVEVKDGHLDLRLFANRRLAMNDVEVWNLGVSWMINYLVVIPSERRDDIEKECWNLILERGVKVRQVTFVDGWPVKGAVRDGHAVLNGKPFMPLMWQSYHGGDINSRNIMEDYSYYLLGNSDNVTDVSWQFKGSQHYMKYDWFMMSAADDYPWGSINVLNLLHNFGRLSFIRTEGLLSFIPQAIEGEGGTSQDSRGRSYRWDAKPPLGSRLAREVQKEAYTMVDFQLKLHPTNAGTYVYEELWHPEDQGYDHNSLSRFYQWLREKYGTLSALNAEWKTNYKEFEEIKPPGGPREDPAWANFRAFRMACQAEDVEYANDTLHELAPEHITGGAKGDYPTASWYHAANIDLFGWYSTPTSRTAAEHFGKTAAGQGALGVDCYFSWIDGRKQLDHKPGPKRYLGRHVRTAYPDLLHDVFEGARWFYFEEYNGTGSHVFHRTKQMQAQNGVERRWSGELYFFDDEAFDYAEVIVDDAWLQTKAFTALMYRTTPILFPTHVVHPRVAIYITDESVFLQGKFVYPTAVIENTLQAIQVSYDLIRRPILDRLDRKEYDVLFLGTFTEMLSPDDAEHIRNFIAAGGKCIFVVPAANRSAIDLKEAQILPGFGFDQLAGCRVLATRGRNINQGLPLVGKPLAAAPGLPTGNILGTVGGAGWVLQPAADSHPFITAGDTQLAMAVANKDSSVITLALGGIENPNPGAPGRDEYLRTLFAGLFASWKVDKGFTLTGATEPEKMSVGVMAGKGYWLVGLTNGAETPQKVRFTLSVLPPGDYEVVDLTGERPLVVKNEKKELHLMPDPEHRYATFVARASADDLKNKGLDFEIGDRKGLVLWIRPADQPVWNCVPDYTVFSRAATPCTIVLTDNPDPRLTEAASRLEVLLKTKKVPVELKKSSEIPIQKTHHEVWITSRFPGVPRDYKGYLVDTFDNQPLSTDRHLIILGGENADPLVKHLGAVNTFTYDKVMLKVTDSFPGPGRGIIQLVDSVNCPYYDATDKTRDAILVGGSDLVGTLKALDRLMTVLKDMPDYVEPVREKQMEVFSPEEIKEMRERGNVPGAPEL